MKSVIISLLLASSFAFAGQQDEKPNLQETYVMFCGSLKMLQTMLHMHGQQISQKEIAEMNQSRKPVLDVLARGNAAIQEWRMRVAKMILADSALF